MSYADMLNYINGCTNRCGGLDTQVGGEWVGIMLLEISIEMEFNEMLPHFRIAIFQTL